MAKPKDWPRCSRARTSSSTRTISRSAFSSNRLVRCEIDTRNNHFELIIYSIFVYFGNLQGRQARRLFDQALRAAIDTLGRVQLGASGVECVERRLERQLSSKFVRPAAGQHLCRFALVARLHGPGLKRGTHSNQSN